MLQNKPGRHRIPFTLNEDNKLAQLVNKYGDKDWLKIASEMENRSVRQCRERWQLFLNINVVKTKWTKEETQLLIEKYQEYGSQWKLLEQFFNGRTIYNIRNKWVSLNRKSKNTLKKNISLEYTTSSQEINDSNITTDDFDAMFEIDEIDDYFNNCLSNFF
ncbi:Myb-like DNA-binding domain containing protein [Tritrichomonas foetus]|uniref:Myb-like DNA-binding domain containing protein n=1 Tax=Tritrichomonas foetus TaxID=1144522 RepID=A0A1J4JJL8_9EUKA|nr:Myb-like DNA-binding domain containing protein [Tritrichomonas foetus]|eukprot:OHS99362.1 Myb-like DNA-binding domain containing protein [Tritrichomonas foetus]